MEAPGFLAVAPARFPSWWFPFPLSFLSPELFLAFSTVICFPSWLPLNSVVLPFFNAGALLLAFEAEVRFLPVSKQ